MGGNPDTEIEIVAGQTSASWLFLALGLLLLSMSRAVFADASRPAGSETGQAGEWAFKLTPSYYRTTHQADAFDVNLRSNYGAHAVWLGYYRRGSEFSQTRLGYEIAQETVFGKLVPSFQLATHRFAGGSLNAEIGDDRAYVLLGFGRTNLKDYYNLNFDPNDSVVYGLGTRLLPGSNLAFYTVKDDRLATGQRVSHLVWRYSPDDRRRWVIDFSAKKGRAAPDEEVVSGGGMSISYDCENVFLRLARDNKVNFSEDSMTRISIGARF